MTELQLASGDICTYTKLIMQVPLLWTVSRDRTVQTLPYLTSGVDMLLHLPSAEAVSARPNAHPWM